MMDKVKVLTQNEETFKAYQRWCEDSMTKLVVEVMLEMLAVESAQPVRVANLQGVALEANALDRARLQGMHECLLRMLNFTNKKMENLPEEDYSKEIGG